MLAGKEEEEEEKKTKPETAISRFK